MGIGCRRLWACTLTFPNAAWNALKVRSGLYRRDHRGVVAIEFAFLALPFFMLMFAILETSLVFIGEITLEQAVSRAGRTVRTGEVASANLTQEAFKKNLCAEILFMLRCDGIKFDLESYATFAAIPTAPPLKNGSLDSGSFVYQPGAPGEIMALRVFYEWPLLTDFMRKALAPANGSTYLLQSTDVFKTEPFR